MLVSRQKRVYLLPPSYARCNDCNDPFSSRSALYRLKVKFTVIAANVVLEAAANRPDFVVMDI